MAAGWMGGLKRARNAARDAVEDWLPHVSLPRLTRADVFARLGIDHSPWDRFESEFKDDVGLATRGDADFLFSMIETLRPGRFLEIGTWRGGTAALGKTISPPTAIR